MDRELLSWKAPEYFRHERTTDWYWWVGLAGVILLALAFWQKSFLFGVLIAISWFTIVLFAVRPPRNIKITLSERGVIIDTPGSDTSGKLYPWSELRSFWIFFDPPLHQELSIESQKSLMPYIKLPLPENPDLEHIKEIVSKYLPEVEQHESLIDNLAHLAKF